MKDLKDDLKHMTFKRVYLLYGEERYLVEHYTRVFSDKLINADNLLMNQDVFDGKEIPADRIMDAANTLPFLCDVRLVYVRDSKLFTAGRKNDTETLAAYLPNIPETTVLVFVETDVDKRNRLYKRVAELGRVAEFVTPPDRELVEWIGNVFKKKGKQIRNENAVKLLRTVMRNMKALYVEADKLGDYVGDRTEITAMDIETVCSPSLETRVFDLVAAVGSGQTENAYRMYRNMLLMKEQPLMILTMIARQFKLILTCKNCMEKHMPPAAIARELELRSFVVDECLRQGRYYTTEQLLAALVDCQDTDILIKTGLLNADIGVELLIARYASA